MERLDFASVMTVLRRNINEDTCPNQVDFVYTLFRDVGGDPRHAMEFDNGQVCRWVNGLAELSPRITSFYQENYNQRKMYAKRHNRFLDVVLKYRCRILFTTRS